MHQTLTKTWVRCTCGLAAPLAAAMIVLGACPGQVQAAQTQCSVQEVTAQNREQGFAGVEIVHSLQQKGTNPANFKVSEVDADIVLDAVALTVGPEGK